MPLGAADCGWRFTPLPPAKPSEISLSRRKIGGHRSELQGPWVQKLALATGVPVLILHTVAPEIPRTSHWEICGGTPDGIFTPGAAWLTRDYPPPSPPRGGWGKSHHFGVQAWSPDLFGSRLKSSVFLKPRIPEGTALGQLKSGSLQASPNLRGSAASSHPGSIQNEENNTH